MALIAAADMPAPRLELRWEKTGETWEERECAYNLVMPLGEHDIRREGPDGDKVRDCMTLEIGRTRVNGGGKYLCVPDDGHIDTPFRDGTHAKWDSDALGGLPIYAVFEQHAMLLPANVQGQGEDASAACGRSPVPGG